MDPGPAANGHDGGSGICQGVTISATIRTLPLRPTGSRRSPTERRSPPVLRSKSSRPVSRQRFRARRSCSRRSTPERRSSVWPVRSLPADGCSAQMLRSAMGTTLHPIPWWNHRPPGSSASPAAGSPRRPGPFPLPQTVTNGATVPGRMDGVAPTAKRGPSPLSCGKTGQYNRAMELRLDASQTATLREILQSAWSDLRYEIADTDNAAYKTGLRDRERIIQSILDALPTEVRSSQP